MNEIITSCCDANVAGLCSLEEVRHELLALVGRTAGETSVPLDACVGRTLARDVVAGFALPPWDNSAMDGYALGPGDDSGRYSVGARTAAGEQAVDQPLGVGEAVRIFTGAPVPKGTFAVAMQENVTRDGDFITVAGTPLARQHIRAGGEDITAGDDLIRAGTVLDTRHVAIMAAMGMAEIPVTGQVRVALFSSGKELQDPGSPLGPASIHDSNRWMLKALLRSPAIVIEDLGILPDDRPSIARTIAGAAERADLILSTGGVSVGEEDHIMGALADIGGDPKQRKISVKPGKPVVFGRIGNAIALGLPGNPVAALVSFQNLARPVIATLSGAPVTELTPSPAVANFDWSRKAGRTEYFSAVVVGRDAIGLPVLKQSGQTGSARLRPLVAGDGLARISGDTTRVSPGDRLDWFPFSPGFAL